MSTLITRIASAALALCLAAAAPAAADLVITPKRVMMEGADRSKTVSVVNTARERRTYDLVWGHMRMDEEGRISDVESDAGGVSSFVVFSPRRITLEPGQSQTIRLALRRPGDLPEGEYRSHLQLKSVNVPDGDGSVEGGQGLGARLNINLSFKLPVIVRQGAGASEVALSAERIDYDGGRLHVRIDRNGPFSVYGDLHAYWRPDESSELSQVGQLNGVAVYPEVARRKVSIPLFADAQPNLTRGEIFVYFVDPAQGNDVLAETGARL
ncbi:MAG: fimbria/pilus periplasmic chaperone [Caulobacterales bacterium]|nr:fimbria/pilus periplasmic chaperone [Caulobacterales bacterium]